MSAPSDDTQRVEGGIPVYGWRMAPSHLRTRRQLEARGLRRNGQDIAGKIPFRRYGREQVAHLYDINLAANKRQATPAQLAALEKATHERQLRVAERHGVDRAEFEQVGDPGPGWTDITTPEVGDIQGVTTMNNRIRLASIDDSVPDREVYIGWDRGLGTYFAQVYDGVDSVGEDVVSLDLGNEPGELPTPDEAIEAVRAYAQIPDDLSSTLTDQREAPGALERSPFAALDIADEPVWGGWDGFSR